MRDRKPARFTRPWTWVGPSLSARSPTLTKSKRPAESLKHCPSGLLKPLWSDGRISPNARRPDVADQRRRPGQKPDPNDRIEDHATPGGGRHKRPKRVTPQMVRQIPGGMRQPCDSDEPIRSKSRVNDGGSQDRVGQLPDP